MSSTIIGPSLPPMVEGQLRCFLSVKLGCLEWSIPRPPKDIQVRILWWGQSGNGALLRPHVDTDPSYVASKNKHSEVHYPVRCGPRQFESYLKDMNSLYLDIIFGPSLTSFACVKIVDIANLSASRILDSYYPLTSTTPAYQGKEVGRLQVLVSYKTISDTYNVSSSIIPTTDQVFQQPPRKKNREKETKKNSSTQPEKHSQKKTSEKSKKEVKISKKLPDQYLYELQSPEQELSKDISFIVGPGASLDTMKHGNKDVVEVLSANRTSDEIFEETDEDIAEPFVSKNELPRPMDKKNNCEGSEICLEPVVLKGEQRTSILSSLLEKTQQLQNSMMKSAVDSNTLHLQRENTSHLKCSGGLIKELLGEELTDGSFDDIHSNIDYSIHRDEGNAIQKMEKIEATVVDLLLGREDNIEKLMKKIDVSIDESNYSDDQDPLHDSALLSELFYTTKAMEDELEESSILFLDDSSGKGHNTKKMDINLHSKEESNIVDDSCDLIPTKGWQKSINNNDSLEGRNIADNTSDIISSTPSHVQDGDSHVLYKTLVSECISVEKLTQLGRVKSAKVILKDFTLSDESMDYGLVYFVEYKFPVSTNENQHPSLEHVHQVSRTVTDIVDFGRFSVFPIIFNEKMVEFWWNNCISFNVHVKYHKQEKPEWFGEGYLKLRNILLNEEFRMNCDLNIYNDACDTDTCKYSAIGQLKLYVELATEQRKLSRSNKTTTTALPPSTISTSKKIQPKEMNTNQLTPIKINTKFKTEKSLTECSRFKVKEQQLQEKSVQPSFQSTFCHNLILVSDGRDIAISVKDDACNLCNSYFVCRVFWNNGELKSKICWSTNNPNYGFQQIVPVNLTSTSISKMENNFMIIEVWHKSTTPNRDKLIGMSKLSLHQYFLSFKDPALADTILKSRYPVIANDGSVPVVNLFSGQEHGSLNVLFAIGTHDQVMQLLQMKHVGQTRNSDLKGNSTREAAFDEDCKRYGENMVKHQLQLTIENGKGLIQDSNEVWGEADCFIQYHFPEPSSDNYDKLQMASFKTETTLCIPNPVFKHTESHLFHLDKSVPLQRILLECFKTSATGEIIFEMWKRHYYPNVRDKLIAKASLPLAKVCAVIMMHSGSDSTHSFHLPLTPVSPLERSNVDIESSGTLDVFLRYKSTICERKNVDLPKQVVCVSASINRLCGLKDGLSWIAKKKKKLNHAVKTGANIFVRTYLSFLGKSSIRTTNVVAKNHCPKFSYHVEFPLPLTLGNDGQTPLAQQLEYGWIVCEVMHEFMEAEEEDILIGVAKIPLIDILIHSTGIKGWWPLKIPKQNREQYEQGIYAGGIEVNAKFASNTDLELVVNMGCGMGWSPLSHINLKDESWISPTYKCDDCKPSILNISVDKVCIPVAVMRDVLPKSGDTRHCFETMYCRYKCYNEAPIYSKSEKVRMQEEKYVCSLSHRSSHKIIPNASFAWYLREEKLEVQFWLRWSNYTAMDATFTRQNDKLVGSVFVDINSFSHSPYVQDVISGQYPLFKANCDNICNATANISIGFNKTITHTQLDDVHHMGNDDFRNDDTVTSDTEESNMFNDTRLNNDERNTQDVNQREMNILADEENNSDKTEVYFHIKEALHLPKYFEKGVANDPSTYVTYQLPNLPLTYTDLYKDSTKPKWNFQKLHKINVEILHGIRLVFYVWRCSGEKQCVDRDVLIGTVEFDTSPLFVGMKQIMGWYNIQDLNRQVVGQINLGVIPSVSISSSKSIKYFRNNCLIQPAVNLNTVPFPKPILATRTTETAETFTFSRMSLFQQVDEKLRDLSELTKRIQQRADHIPYCDYTEPFQSKSEIIPEKEVETYTQKINTIISEQDAAIQPCLRHDNGSNKTVDRNSEECTTNDFYSGELTNRVINDQIYMERIDEVDTFAKNSEIEDQADVSANLVENIKDIEMLDEMNELSTSNDAITYNALFPDDIFEGYREEVTESNSIVNRHDSGDQYTLHVNTDKLLDNLKEFEKQYADIKGTLEKDNNFQQDGYIRDTELIDINLVDHTNIGISDITMKRNPSSNLENEFFMENVEENKEIEPNSGITMKKCLIENTFSEENIEEDNLLIDNPHDMVVNICSSDPSKEDIHSDEINNVFKEDAILNNHDWSSNAKYLSTDYVRETSNLSNNPKETSAFYFNNQESGSSDEEESTYNFTALAGEYDKEFKAVSSPGIKSRDSRQNTESRDAVNLPNFFMRPRELAESMQALHIAANYRRSPRTRSVSSVDDAVSEASLSANSAGKSMYLRNGDKMLKQKIRDILPVEASEMARIASIFASNKQ